MRPAGRRAGHADLREQVTEQTGDVSRTDVHPRKDCTPHAIPERYAPLGPASKPAHDKIRSLVPTLEQDRYLADDIENVAAAPGTGEFLKALDGTGGRLHRAGRHRHTQPQGW